MACGEAILPQKDFQKALQEARQFAERINTYRIIIQPPAFDNPREVCRWDEVSS